MVAPKTGKIPRAAPRWSKKADILVTTSRWQLPFVLLLAFLLRLPTLNESLWYDEVWYCSDKLFSDNWKVWVFGDIHPPLYALMMRTWLSIVPETELTLRFPSLCLGLLGVFCAYRLGQLWFGDRIALWSGLLLAACPAHIWYSQENKANMVSVTLLALSLVLVERWCRQPKPANAVIFSLVAVAALASHTFALPFLAAVGLWLWLRSFLLRDRQTLKTLIPMTLVIGGCALAMVWIQLSSLNSHGRGYLGNFTLGELYKFVLIWLPNGGTFRPSSPWKDYWSMLREAPGWLLVDLFYLGFLVLGHRALGRLLRAQPTHPAGLVLLTLWVPLLGTLLASAIVPRFYIDRNLLATVTPFVLVLGVGCQEAGRARWLLLLSGVASLSCLWVFRAEEWTVYKPNPNYREAASILRRERDKVPDQPFVVFEFTGGPDTLVFYDKRAQIRHLHDRAAPQEPNFMYYLIHNLEEAPQLAEIVSHYSLATFYLVQDTGPAYMKQITQDLQKDPRYTQKEHWKLKRLDVYKFQVNQR